MPTCTQAICSSTRPAAWLRSTSELWGALAQRSGASSPKFFSASSPATIAASLKCISGPGYGPGHHPVDISPRPTRATGEPIHNRTAEEISMAKLLTLLLEVTGLFDMRTRPELILLQKTMVVVEGVARSFDPKLDIWKVADPVVREWIEHNLGPVGRLQGAMSGAGDLGRVLAGLPAVAARSVTVLEQLEKMTGEGLTLSPETIAAMGRAEGR